MNAESATQERSLGLFDSGLGGLSVLKQFVSHNQKRKLFQQFVYVADSGRCPYGNRPKEEIIQFARELTGWLDQQGVSDTVIACNTSASIASTVVRHISAACVHDLISPACQATSIQGKRIAIMATANTINSGIFKQRLHLLDPSIAILELACPDLVPLIESGQLSGPEVTEKLRPYAQEIHNFNASSVILGCTHFPFLSAVLQTLLPDKKLVDPAYRLASELWMETSPSQQESPANSWQNVSFYTTGDAALFAQRAALCLDIPVTNIRNRVHHLSLETVQKMQVSLPLSAQQAILPAN